MRTKRFLLMSFLALFLVLSFSFANFAQAQLPDTVYVESIQIDPHPTDPVVFSLRTYLFATQPFSAASLGLFYDSDDIDIDSIVLTGGGAEGSISQSQLKPDSNLAVVGWFGFPGMHTPFPASDSLMATLWFTLAASAPDQVINIDSGFFPPAGNFVLTNVTGNSVFPAYKPGTITVGSAPPDAELVVDPLALTFNATEGGANPANQSFSITELGGGTDAWTASETESWLSLSATSGAAPADVDVIVDISGLTAGPHVGTVTVTMPGADNSPQDVTITLNLAEPPPTIGLSQTTFDFNAVEGAKANLFDTLAISNTGGGTMSWTAAKAESWLTIDPASGTAPSNMELAVVTDGLTAGPYSDTITVSAAGATNTPQKVIVNLTIDPAPAEIDLSVATLDFSAVEGGSDPAGQFFDLTNTGGQNLNYTATVSTAWLLVDPTAGIVVPAGTQQMTVGVSISGLTAGTYEDTIVVADAGASNSPQKVAVTLTVDEPAPEIAVDPAAFIFDAVFATNPANQDLDITNTGGGTLNYSISKMTAWLTVAPTGGTAPGTSTLSVNTAGLAVGTYYDTLTISAPGATSVKVPVTLNVLDLDPVIDLDQTQYYFALEQGNNSNSGTLGISNGGGGTLNWSASKLQSWLTIDPTSGTAPSTLTLTVNSIGLALGTYYDTITVVGAGAVNSPQIVEVVMDVVAEAQFVVTQESTPITELVFEGDAAKALTDQVINIASSGGAIEFGITNNQAWLGTNPTDGTTPLDVSVGVNIAGLSAGTYYDTLFISEVPAKQATTFELPVTLILHEVQPQFVVDPVEFTFNSTGGFDPSSQNLNITSDGEALNFDLSHTSTWLSLSSYTGATEADIDVNASIEGLAAGTYYDTIVVMDADVKIADPVNVPVTLVVEAAYDPIIALDPAIFLFEATEGGANPGAQTLNITNAGTGDLTWNASYDAGWLMVSPGNSGTAPSAVSLSVDISGLIADTYVDTIEVSSPEASNSPQLAVVTLVVNPESSQGGDTVWVTTDTTVVGQDAVVELMFINDNLISGIQVPLYFDNTKMTCDSVSFAGSRVEGADLLLAPIDNAAGTINIGVVPTESALIPSGDGLMATMYFSAIATGFAAIDTGFIDPASEYVFVDENVQPFYPVFDDGGVLIEDVSVPHIEVSSTEFNFEGDQGGADPATQDLTMTNSGVGTLSWTVVNTTSWLSLNPTFGGDGDASTLTVSLTGLTAGTYGDSIVVSDAGADNSPVIVFVNLTVNPPPAAMDTVRVETVTVNPHPTDPVVFNVPVTLYNMEIISAASLGLYYGPGDVTIDSVSLVGGGAENTIDNSVEDPGNRLGVIGFLYFPGPPGASPVPPGDSLLANLWFTLAAGAADQVIPIDSGYFPPAGQFVLTSDGGVSIKPAYVAGSIIVETVVEPPALAVDPMSLAFEGVEGEVNNVTQNVNITNTGGGDLNWTADYQSGWLNVTPLLGTAPSVLDVTVNMAGLTPDTYVDTITIDAVGVANAPQKVVVTLTVTPAPPEPGLEGTVVEADGGAPVANAYVAVFDVYPGDGALDLTMTDGAGYFEFPDLPVGDYMLRAYKDGYYPGMLEVEVGKTAVVVELIEVDQVPIPTYEWVNFYCDDNYFAGELIQAGDVIEAYDPDGVLCGQFYVETEGAYGFMPVYRDDEYDIEVDEGCEPGDMVSFKINDYPAMTNVDAYWTENGDEFEICLDADAIITKCIELDEGWNLISWNIDTESDDIEDLIADIKTDIDVILGFETGALTYDPDLPGFNTLEYLDHFHGFWFRMDNAATLCLTGIPVEATTPIALEMGWNLASYLPDAEDDIEHALAGIMDYLLMVLGFDGGGLSYDPALGEFSTLLTMKPCFGYWLKVTDDIMLTYPGEVVPGYAKAVPDIFSNQSEMPSVTVTNTWVNAYGQNLIVDGEPIAKGSLIEAVDANGNICGSCNVTETGKFGFMAIYGAENGTGEGLINGDQYAIRVNGVDAEEAFTFTGNGDRTMIGSLSLKSGGNVVPSQFSLSQNYPNPFNPETTISFDIPVEARVKLTIFNILGEKVTTLIDEQKAAGSYTVIWSGQTDNGSTVSSGIYFYRLDAGEYVKSMKMTLMK
jgi:Carboxypeptidase regulatory-like domain/Viral BACON domain